MVTDEDVRPDEKVHASSCTQYSGGQGANAAWTLAALGLKVQFVGAFGDDKGGTRSALDLRTVGVSLRGSVKVPDCRSQLGVVLVEAATGKRSIVMYRDPRLRLGSAPDSATIRRTRLIYTDGHEHECSLATARRARSLGVPVVLDAESAGAQTRELLPLVTCLIAPLAVVRALAHSEQERSALEALTSPEGPTTVVATDGSRGSIGMRRGGPLMRVPAVACVPKDTTGAGDAYHAGFVSAALGGVGLEAAMRFAAELGAAACETDGPRIAPKRVALLRARLPVGLPSGGRAGPAII